MPPNKATNQKKTKQKSIVPGITLYTGPCASGKTSTALLQTFRDSQLFNTNVLYIVHWKKSTQGIIKTRDNLQIDNAYSLKRIEELFQLKEWNTHHIIYIDEGFMFNDLIKIIDHMNHKHFIVSTIDRNFEGRMFRNVMELGFMATKKVTLSAVCDECGCENACWTARKCMNKNTQLIDCDNSKYVTLCLDCFGRYQPMVKNNPIGLFNNTIDNID